MSEEYERAWRRAVERTIACDRAAHGACSGMVDRSSYGAAHECACECHLPRAVTVGPYGFAP